MFRGICALAMLVGGGINIARSNIELGIYQISFGVYVLADVVGEWRRDES